ncbi:MAG: TM0106 family RecB-like putative nuclease [Pseudomonadota bacterium]
MHRATIKPSDAVAWVSCHRRAWLDNKYPERCADDLDAFDQLVMELGNEHEQSILTKLRTQFEVATASSVAHTEALMKQGTEVIYQAQLFNEAQLLIGYPDFLLRQDDGYYQAADAKLSLTANKKEIQIQLGCYRRLLGNDLPAKVFLGDGSQSIITSETDKLTEQFIDSMRTLLASDVEPSAHYGHSKCGSCQYVDHCKPQFVANGDLTLLYGVDGRAAKGLERVGIDSISALADSDPARIPDVPYLKGDHKKQRAVLQAQSWFSGEYHQLRAIDLPEGTWVHFDIEDNPLTSSGDKHVYLWGFLLPDYSAAQYECVWTGSEDQDKAGWLAFLDRVAEYQERYPDLVLAHYASHERTTIQQYATRYAMQDHCVVQCLLGSNSPLFDIQKPVKNNLVLPLQGYGLKDICKHNDLVNFQWSDDGSGSQWSIVQFIRYLDAEDPHEKAELKDDIISYNRDDVIATRQLEQWLRYSI